MFYNNTQQLAEHKLLLLYILDRFEIPLTNTQLTQFVMEKDYMNYFLLQQYLGELVSSSMLEYSESEGNYFYLITEKGKNTLQFFSDRLSSTLTATLDQAVEMKKQVLLKEMQILADYTKKKESEYIVDLKVIENDITLIDLKLNVVSNKYAKEICDKWKREAPKLYGEIIHLLIQ
ncbi:protein of unknown function [Geosporobacter subterraneus DSM 17957]|uniref:DUF4364 domain-containing protein n=1 Tax=Geosporobacter subterraneus DSM 17957 TaxID=1121919 RepID=A0A1M6KQX4_9FIRM|nr:DUF4364 family protein [Geosporobacter subterraneus]SHJ61290.1 protein of unknown function [Geosporobacter subterraneus DSM 17957]